MTADAAIDPAVHKLLARMYSDGTSAGLTLALAAADGFIEKLGLADLVWHCHRDGHWRGSSALPQPVIPERLPRPCPVCRAPSRARAPT
ncbi:hypothetical protein BI380_00010 [Delftia tsuruhatensis]|uniref:Uncharacterized protein n=1 Tax=Delftia tsuruhatensis TaxID=180282 RepID=A0ABN4SEG0_9BURK|nr:hypothetical protein BI380_00010 [Delftia tsuruhatensis]